MKINEVIINEKEQLNEFINLNDFGTFVRSVFQNVGTQGLTWQDIKNRAMQDRGIKLAGQAIINQWKKIKYSLLKAQGDVSVDDLKNAFTKFVEQVGADPVSVQAEIDTIARLDDKLNTRQALDAATNIALSSLASQWQQRTGQDLEPGDEEEIPQEKEGRFDYGYPITKKMAKGDLVPVVIVYYEFSEDDAAASQAAGYEVENGAIGTHRYVKYNGKWFVAPISDERGKEGTMLLTNRMDDDATGLELLKIFEREVEKERFGKSDNPSLDLELTGVQQINNSQFVIPDAETVQSWKTRTGRVQ